MAAATLRHIHQPVFHQLPESLALVPAITSLLQSLNPQNPKTRQNPNPSVLAQFSPYLTPKLVIDVIKNQANPFHSLFFFNWASSLNPNPNQYYPTHFCYVAITDKLLSHKLLSLATHLLKTHDRYSDFMVSIFIKVHGYLGHLRWAAMLFRRVKDREIGSKCLFSFNALLDALVKSNRPKYAWGYFGLFVVKACAVEPDASTHTILTKGLCEVGMIEDAQKLFDEMICEKTLMNYNVIIDGFCKKGLLKDARRILDEMVRDVVCSLNTVSYTSLIDGYCKKRDLANALRCFDEMINSGNCKPNAVTYNLMIKGLCLNGDVDEARRMIGRMRLDGLRDNISTHTNLLRGYCVAGRSDEAIEHFKEMVNQGMILDKMSYGVIVHEYCKLGRPDEAIALLHEMRAKRIPPRLSSFNAVFRNLVKLHQLDKVIHLLKRMTRMGCYPNFISYREVIIGLLGSKGRTRDAQMLVDALIQDGHDLDTTLYSSLIKAFCVDGDTDRAVRLFKEMIDENLVINIE